MSFADQLLLIFIRVRRRFRKVMQSLFWKPTSSLPRLKKPRWKIQLEKFYTDREIEDRYLDDEELADFLKEFASTSALPDEAIEDLSHCVGRPEELLFCIDLYDVMGVLDTNEKMTFCRSHEELRKYNFTAGVIGYQYRHSIESIEEFTTWSTEVRRQVNIEDPIVFIVHIGNREMEKEWYIVVGN